ncbi:MAG: hypothetical protein QXD25_00135 [Nanopusillaceae archaeon]
MSEFAFNKIAMIVLSLIVLITIIFLIYIYYSGYSESERKIYNATNESWINLNVSNICYFENIVNISNNVSNYVKTIYNCTQINYDIKEIREKIINFKIECTVISSNLRTTYLCDVSYNCEKKTINISSCKAI